LRPAIVTRAPPSISRRAVASPIPDVPPMTMATLLDGALGWRWSCRQT
jgi:hypothetical protein